MVSSVHEIPLDHVVHSSCVLYEYPEIATVLRRYYDASDSKMSIGTDGLTLLGYLVMLRLCRKVLDKA